MRLTHLCSAIDFSDNKHGIMQVDCKRDESFGKLINLKSKKLRDVVIDYDGKVSPSTKSLKIKEIKGDWGGHCYLRRLCKVFSIEPKDAVKLPFEMLLRAADVLDEAYSRTRNFGKNYDTAIWLIHSSSKDNKGFEEFCAFSKLLGIPLKKPGCISGPARLIFKGKYDYDKKHWSKVTMNFYLGWIVDKKPYNYTTEDYRDDSIVEDNKSFIV